MYKTQVSSITNQQELILPLDAFVRSIAIQRSQPHALFLGAGASITSGVPSAEKCIWEWKRSIFATKNPGLEDQVSELSLPSVQRHIQDWLDRQGGYPVAGSPEEYSFYIECCYPISADRQAYFKEKVLTATPHVGYRLVCHLAQNDLFRSVWTTNFDGITARTAANFKLSPIEVGIDTLQRLSCSAKKGELLCVSLHGDYRYDALKNTPSDLREMEADLRQALADELRNTSLIVCGYSGRDLSVMEALKDAFSNAGSGNLFWCGFSDGGIPNHIADLIRHARTNNRKAFYISSQGFDDLMTRLALHCLSGQTLEAAKKDISQLASKNLLDRIPFQVVTQNVSTLIKSNAFEIECPAEVLQFELKTWPQSKVWSWLREQTKGHKVVAVPFKGKVLAIGLVDNIREIFGDNIKGNIERTPITPKDCCYEDGVIVRLMREALIRTMAETMNVETDGKGEIWLPTPEKSEQKGGLNCLSYESLIVFLRLIGNTQYLVLKPSIKVLTDNGEAVPREIADPIKLTILGWQHNKPFNRAINKWSSTLFPDKNINIFEYPKGCGSTFKFKVRKYPVFGAISRPKGVALVLPPNVKPLLKHRGIEIAEPELLFSNRNASQTVKDTHPIRGIVTNRPYDFPLTLRGLASTVRLGVVCPQIEAKLLTSYLSNAQHQQSPSKSERDYLIDYPGFQQAYGLPLEIPKPGDPGWVDCAEPADSDSGQGAIEVARNINTSIQSLQSSYAPQVVLILFPDRWSHLRGYKNQNERFDVHDFVKAFCVQRGVTTQFLNQSTLLDSQ